MPVILDQDSMDKWTNCKRFTISECLHDISLLEPSLKFHPVSKIVNSPKNNSAQNIREKKPNQTLNFFPN